MIHQYPTKLKHTHSKSHLRVNAPIRINVIITSTSSHLYKHWTHKAISFLRTFKNFNDLQCKFKRSAWTPACDEFSILNYSIFRILVPSCEKNVTEELFCGLRILVFLIFFFLGFIIAPTVKEPFGNFSSFIGRGKPKVDTWVEPPALCKSAWQFPYMWIFQVPSGIRTHSSERLWPLDHISPLQFIVFFLFCNENIR